MPGLHKALPQGGLALRAVEEADLPFLFALYASTRAEELAPVPWSEEQKLDFLRMQFRAQQAHYLQHYGGDHLDLVLVDGAPAGRLYVGCWAREVRVIDIALLPQYRAQGLGAALLGAVIEEAAEHGLPVSISVEKLNPARRLYQRLGFVQTEDLGVYDLMVRPA